MNPLRSLLIPILLAAITLPTFANDYEPNPVQLANTDDSDSLKDLARYLRNLGSNLGYNIDDDSVVPMERLIDTTYAITAAGPSIISVLFSAIPVNAFSTALSTFTKDDYAKLNGFANATFKAYGKPSDTDISVTENFDQKEWQNDPVSQAVLNLVGTPDYTACNPDSKNPCLSSYIVMEKVLLDLDTMAKDDKLPGETLYYSFDNNKQFISQLNSNTLIAPLLYSNEKTGEGTANGLPSKSQAIQAEEFVRYATSAVLPIPTITDHDYSLLLTDANAPLAGSTDKTTPSTEQIVNSRAALASYLISLRVYAAQSSVAISNMYGILAKRMPQDIKVGDASTTTSQALLEFQMATWRMNNPSKEERKDQWVEKINTASPATVQKEIAILLSEINYQLYLTRQQDERILLTNSLQLLQALAQKPPNPSPSVNNSENQTS